ncbi:MAG: hypothetical protein HQK51_02905 [Oligoflexia bacterium]|nr:hypothetical protein [Oligoflexia bacterium]
MKKFIKFSLTIFISVILFSNQVTVFNVAYAYSTPPIASPTIVPTASTTAVTTPIISEGGDSISQVADEFRIEWEDQNTDANKAAQIINLVYMSNALTGPVFVVMAFLTGGHFFAGTGDTIALTIGALVVFVSEITIISLLKNEYSKLRQNYTNRVSTKAINKVEDESYEMIKNMRDSYEKIAKLLWAKMSMALTAGVIYGVAVVLASASQGIDMASLGTFLTISVKPYTLAITTALIITAAMAVTCGASFAPSDDTSETGTPVPDINRISSNDFTKVGEVFGISKGGGMCVFAGAAVVWLAIVAALLKISASRIALGILDAATAFTVAGFSGAAAAKVEKRITLLNTFLERLRARSIAEGSPAPLIIQRSEQEGAGTGPRAEGPGSEDPSVAATANALANCACAGILPAACPSSTPSSTGCQDLATPIAGITTSLPVSDFSTIIQALHGPLGEAAKGIPDQKKSSENANATHLLGNAIKGKTKKIIEKINKMRAAKGEAPIDPFKDAQNNFKDFKNKFLSQIEKAGLTNSLNSISSTAILDSNPEVKNDNTKSENKNIDSGKSTSAAPSTSANDALVDLNSLMNAEDDQLAKLLKNSGIKVDITNELSNYDLSKKDVNTNTGASIWDIITTRYKKSAYPVFLIKKKAVETKK